jgi:MFS family permease
MMTYAVDAAVAVALANTLFFAAARAESVTNVALYLAITAAPFAVVAPVIGPLLDRVQRGRRAALALTFALRAVLAVVMAFQYHTWLLYPAALGTLVLSKSFVVLKAAVTPRVLPSAITLVTTNSRLTTFGLAAGGVFGGIAAGVAWLWGSEGALVYTALLAVAGTVLCLRIPKWVESTAGEVPAALRATRRGRRMPMSRSVVVALWGNGAIRVLTGFLTLFVAFVIKQTDAQPTQQLLLIGIVGAAAGVGSFAGNGAGSRPRSLSGVVVLWCVGRRSSWRPWRRRCRHRHGRGRRARRGGRERARQGQPGRGDPARPPGGVARFGVRPLGDRAAARLGHGRRARRAAAARHVLGRLHRRGLRRRAGRGADRAAVPRPQHRPVPRGEGPAGGADRARGAGVIGCSGASPRPPLRLGGVARRVRQRRPRPR